jgi:hypothetical protein
MTAENTLDIFKNVGCNTGLKVNFSCSHLDYSAPDCGGFSDKRRKNFTRT